MSSKNSGGGYVADLGRNGANAIEVINKLEESNWLDVRTRVVLLEFLAYNPNTQLYTTATIACEFLGGTSGTKLANAKIKALKLNQYSGSNGSILILLQLATFSCILFLLYKEVHDLYFLGFDYFQVTHLAPDFHMLEKFYNYNFKYSVNYHVLVIF